MTHLLSLLILTAAPTEPLDIYQLDAAAFADTARADLKTLQQFVTGMQSVLKHLETKRSLFKPREAIYSPEEKQALLSAWGSLFAYFSATEGLRHKYWNFVKLPPTDARHAWGFVVTHTALTALLAHGLTFASLARGNKQLEVLFDEPGDEYGVPRGAFAKFKLKAIHVATSTQLFTGDTWAPLAKPSLQKQKVLSEAGIQWAFTQMQRDSKVAKAQLKHHGAQLYAGNTKDLAVDTSLHTIFPVQKTFAEWLGDTRVKRRGRVLVTADDIAAHAIPKLLPGDIIVTRQNWFLSNIGLPGFWPHAELYVGTAADLSRSFDAEADVVAWAKSQPEKAATFSELLRKRYPAKWKAYADGPDFQGHAPIRVIESISEGVSFTAVEHALGVDYLGALRPRLSSLDKARAVERAFKYQGRPYDFNFDFFSDATLVCTELVFKAYQPSKDTPGVTLPLVEVAGRKTLPANDIVRTFDEAHGTPEQQLDFVLFLDGNEKAGRVTVSDEAAFRASWKRLKWDVAQD